MSYAFSPCVNSSQKRNHKRKTFHLNIQGGEAAFFQHLVIYCLTYSNRYLRVQKYRQIAR